jgi:hypothetical protein
MSRITWVVITLFLFSVIPVTAQEEYYRSSYLELEANIQTTLTLYSERLNAKLGDVNAFVSFFPIETPTQKIKEQTFTPHARRNNDQLIFTWKRPEIGKLPLSINTKLRVESKPFKLREKVPFPIQGAPVAVQKYTRPAEIIDINQDIIRKASELAEGEDDLLVVVDNIAAWVTENVEYNLSTSTAEATQKASWVYTNKYGVCDELTSLFISMLRSLNIPAKFVAGIAYTNLEGVSSKWGPHGWAEVYFPGHGWVPYDVTYGEYGSLDATHIKAKESLDAEKITTKFEWRGRGVKLDVSDFKTDVKVTGKGKRLDPRIKLDVSFLGDKVGFGSYNLVQGEVSNLVGYYQPLDLFISRTAQLTVFGNNKQHILLAPHETKKFFWVVKVQEQLEKKFVYSFPVSVYTVGEINARKMFKAASGAHRFSESEITQAMGGIEKSKKATNELHVACTTPHEEYMPSDFIKVSCTLENKGNGLLKNIKTCFKEICQTEDLGITQTSLFTFPFQEKSLGLHVIEVTSTASNDVQASSRLQLKLVDQPQVNIRDVDYPSTFHYGDMQDVSFTIGKASQATPRKITVMAVFNGMEEKFEIEELSQDQHYAIKVQGKNMQALEEPFTIKVGYHDQKGQYYETQEEVMVRLQDVTFGQRAHLFFNKLGGLLG